MFRNFVFLIGRLCTEINNLLRRFYEASSSIGNTARCGLWPVAQYRSIFSCLSPTFLHLLNPSTWRSLSTFSFHPFLGLPLRLVPYKSGMKIFLGILPSSILSRWPNQLILCPFIHFTVFYHLFISYSSRFVLLFHSPFSYLGPYILLNFFFFSKISTACSSFYVIVNVSFQETQHIFIERSVAHTRIYPEYQNLYSLTFRHHTSCILGQAFRYSPMNAFYIFNQQIYFIIWYLLDRASLI